MTDMLKFLGQTLSTYYGAIVRQPMPWRVIDTLVTLEEAEETGVGDKQADRNESSTGRSEQGRPEREPRKS
jgi:hypothetical protein